jgi:hypothetical protein
MRKKKQKEKEKEKTLEDKSLREEAEKLNNGEEIDKRSRRRANKNPYFKYRFFYCGLCDEYYQENNQHEHKKEPTTKEKPPTNEESTETIKATGLLKDTKYFELAFKGYKLCNIRHAGWHCDIQFSNKNYEKKLIISSNKFYVDKAIKKIENYMDNLNAIVLQVKIETIKKLTDRKSNLHKSICQTGAFWKFDKKEKTLTIAGLFAQVIEARKLFTLKMEIVEKHTFIFDSNTLYKYSNLFKKRMLAFYCCVKRFNFIIPNQFIISKIVFFVIHLTTKELNIIL